MNKDNSNEDAWLDAMLSTPSDYIKDDGFTDLVMKALPPMKKRRTWLEPALVLTAATVSSVIAALLIFPSSNAIYQSVMSLILGQSLLNAILFLMLIGTGMAALSWYIAEANGK